MPSLAASPHHGGAASPEAATQWRTRRVDTLSAAVCSLVEEIRLLRSGIIKTMNDMKFLAPPAILLSAALKRSMDKQGLSLREVLRTFNDPERQFPIAEPAGPLAALQAQQLHVRERTITGRRISLLCRWDTTAHTWELAHATVWRLTH